MRQARGWGVGGVKMALLKTNRPFDSHSSHADITPRHSRSLTCVYSVDAWITARGSQRQSECGYSASHDSGWVLILEDFIKFRHSCGGVETEELKAYQISAASSPTGSSLINLPEVICRSQLQIAQVKIAPYFPCAPTCMFNQSGRQYWTELHRSVC